MPKYNELTKIIIDREIIIICIYVIYQTLLNNYSNEIM